MNSSATDARRKWPCRGGYRRRVEFECIALDQLEPPRICRGQLGQRGEATPVALDRDDMGGPLFEQSPRQPARPWPDLDNGAAVERPGGACDAPRHIEVEDEILPEAPLRRDAVPGDQFAQWRQCRRIGNHRVGGHPRRRCTVVSKSSPG